MRNLPSVNGMVTCEKAGVHCKWKGHKLASTGSNVC